MYLNQKDFLAVPSTPFRVIDPLITPSSVKASFNQRRLFRATFFRPYEFGERLHSLKTAYEPNVGPTIRRSRV